MATGGPPRRNGFAALGRALFARGGPGLGRRIGALPRMLGARFRGRYTGMSWGRFVALIVAAVYVISPIDLIPEAFLLVFGLADDGVALAWLSGALLDEAERFLHWEQAQQRPPGFGPGRPGPGQFAPGQPPPATGEPDFTPGPEYTAEPR